MKRKPIKTSKVDTWVNLRIGQIKGKCPKCGDDLYVAKIGTEWCSDCGYSNDEDTAKFILELGE